MRIHNDRQKRSEQHSNRIARVQVSSSKPVFGQWWGEQKLDVISDLSVNQRIQQIGGTFTNPFDRELTNCRLLFQNWIYILERPLKVGETIDVSTEMKEKTVKNYLTRRAAGEQQDRSSNQPWNPTDTNLNRITDMLMFYGAAGGSNYTKLTHDYQRFIDLSPQLDLNRAILIGEFKDVVTELKINGESSKPNYDRVHSVIRIILPVDNTTSRNQ